MSVLDHPSPTGPRPSGPGVPPSPEQVELVVRPWWDPGLATAGYDPRDAYVERFWLGVLGPSAVVLIRRLARGLEEHPEGFRICLADTARAIGLGAGTGRQSPINRTIERACMFNTMRRVSADELQVRTHLPRLTARQLARLPLAVRRSHDAWVTDRPRFGAPPPHAA